MDNPNDPSQEAEPVNEPADEQPEISINEDKLNQYLDKLRVEQNLPLGLIGGLIAALVGAALWAVITVTTEYQIGYMAIAVGFIVGFTMKFTGKGIDKIFGIVGAALSLVGCLLGNCLSVVGFISIAEGIEYFETLAMIDYSLMPEIMMSTFSPIDLLFYGIAVYEGYKFSFRTITEQEIIEHAT